MEQPTVLIISDDADFARNVMGRWQSERNVPAFTLMSSDLWSGASAAAYELAIVGPVRSGRLTSMLKTLDSGGAPVIFVADDFKVGEAVRSGHPRVLVLRWHEEWPDALVVLAMETLRRVELQARIRRAEQAVTAAQHLAALGRYMLDMRHGMNNALTSVLGNAELLLLEPDALPAPVRDQIETVQNMALRMHEILQRFSSLETEMQFAEKASQTENRGSSHGAASGQ